MLEILIQGMPQRDSLELVNAADSSSITPVFLALQR
jgi:hypothetical protein